MINLIKKQLFKKNRITKVLLTEDSSDKTEILNYTDIYVVLPEFYDKYVKGNESFITKLLHCKSIAVLYNSRVEDNISFIHNTKANSSSHVIESILNEGIQYTKKCPIPLGTGIYVWKENSTHITTIPNKNSFKINNYEGQYLKLVYYENSAYEDPYTEYILLKICQKNFIHNNI